MCTYQGQIYLIDFGIARYFKPGQSKDTLVLGSPGYAAPEQYGRAQTTPQTDMYSLGALLHELLSGIHPSQSPFSQRPLDLPSYPQLSVLISCMLSIDVKKRPVCMGNIQRELQRIAVRRVLPPPTPMTPGIDNQNRKLTPRLPRSITQKMFRIHNF
jgi:serine/threonine protein kinase